MIAAIALSQNCIKATETAEPEASLKPRNFNPHPYSYSRPVPLNRDNALQNINFVPSSSNFFVQKARKPLSRSSGIFNQGPIQFPDNARVPNDILRNDIQETNPYQRIKLLKARKSYKYQQRNDYDYVGFSGQMNRQNN